MVVRPDNFQLIIDLMAVAIVGSVAGWWMGNIAYMAWQYVDAWLGW